MNYCNLSSAYGNFVENLPTTQCPLCGNFVEFLDNKKCPSCNSNGRQRHIWIYLSEYMFPNISNDISNKYGDKLIKVVYPKSYLIKFEKIISTIYTFIFVIGIVVLVVSIFNVSNIIKLSLEIGCLLLA